MRNYTLLFSFSFLLSTIHATIIEDYYLEKITSEEAIKQIPPDKLFPLINNVFEKDGSKITYSEQKQEYMIALTDGTYYTKTLALHQESSQFIVPFNHYQSTKTIIIGVLSAGRVTDQVELAQDKDFDLLDFPDRNTFIATSGPRILVFKREDPRAPIDAESKWNILALDTANVSPVCALSYNAETDRLSAAYENKKITTHKIPSTFKDEAPIKTASMSTFMRRSPATILCTSVDHLAGQWFVALNDNELCFTDSIGYKRHFLNECFTNVKAIFPTGKSEKFILMEEVDGERRFYKLGFCEMPIEEELAIELYQYNQRLKAAERQQDLEEGFGLKELFGESYWAPNK